MILFPCPRCAQKFRSKNEMAGRSARCPRCKQRPVVPTPQLVQAFVPAGQIDGMPSSLVQIGVDGGGSLERHSTKARPTQKSDREMLSRQTGKSQCYVIVRDTDRGVAKVIKGDGATVIAGPASRRRHPTRPAEQGAGQPCRRSRPDP